MMRIKLRIMAYPDLQHFILGLHQKLISATPSNMATYAVKRKKVINITVKSYKGKLLF